MSTLPITPIHTNNAPAAIGPFSQACIAGDFLFISGQGGISPESGKVAGSSLESQAEQLMQNLKAILEQAGTDFSRVVKATCFLADMDDFSAFNAIYAKYFTSKPARSCIAVKALPMGILCEIEAIVYLGE